MIMPREQAQGRNVPFPGIEEMMEREDMDVRPRGRPAAGPLVMGMGITAKQWSAIVHLLAAVGALALWVMSIQFSTDGFGFMLPEYRWMGYVLGLVITVLELVFNEEGTNHTMTLLIGTGLAYLYGVSTNIMGILWAQGNPEMTSNIARLVFASVLGGLLEIMPEPLFAWAIGRLRKDPLGHLFGG